MGKVIAVAATWLAMVAVGAAQMPASSAAPPAASSTPSSAPMGSTMSMPADTAQNPFFGSVPTSQVTPGALQLSVADAIDRGLKYNLGLLLSSAQTEAARGARWRALSDLVPNVSARVGESFQQVNTAVFGFHFPGIPTTIGPFGLFDTRAFATEDLSFRDWHNFRATNENLRAAEQMNRNARELVVLAVGATYLQAIAGAARVDAVQAQLNTAQALYKQAVDMKNSGVVAGIDVLRAQVEMQAQQQRLVFSRNEFAKAKLTLGRVIGLPAAQEFELSEKLPYRTLPALSLDEALSRAYQTRSDYQAALSRVRAAELNKRAAEAERLPSLQFSADYGDVGNRLNRMDPSYTVTGGVRIPILQGGKVRGDVQQADAALRQVHDLADNLRSQIEYEVRTSVLDVQAAGEQVQVAQEAQKLAAEELKQAQDRYAAGVAGNLEVVQAQQSVATADENLINSLNSFNVSKLLLARALGVAEQRVKEYLKGPQ